MGTYTLLSALMGCVVGTLLNTSSVNNGFLIPLQSIDNATTRIYNQLLSTILIRTPLIRNHSQPLEESSREVGGGRFKGTGIVYKTTVTGAFYICEEPIVKFGYRELKTEIN